jgi:hypothetical protein
MTIFPFGAAGTLTHGRKGRSWGCFALSPRVESAIVSLIRGGTVLVGYYPGPQWLAWLTRPPQ